MLRHRTPLQCSGEHGGEFGGSFLAIMEPLRLEKISKLNHQPGTACALPEGEGFDLYSAPGAGEPPWAVQRGKDDSPKRKTSHKNAGIRLGWAWRCVT